MNGALLTLGIFAALVVAWAAWPRFFWPVPDPEEGSGGTSSGDGRAPEPSPERVDWNSAPKAVRRQGDRGRLPTTILPRSSPARRFAWRRWNALGGEIISRPFDTPEGAGRYRAALADPRRLTLIRLEDGELAQASGEEACAALLTWVDRTRETAA